jgi:hypothetical protein
MVDVMNTNMTTPLPSIHFNNEKSLATFLATFISTGSTAHYSVVELGEGHFLLQFSGAY